MAAMESASRLITASFVMAALLIVIILIQPGHHAGHESTATSIRQGCNDMDSRGHNIEMASLDLQKEVKEVGAKVFRVTQAKLSSRKLLLNGENDESKKDSSEGNGFNAETRLMKSSGQNMETVDMMANIADYSDPKHHPGHHNL